MRSIYGMPCDELAGVAKRRVPLPQKRRKANAKHLWNALRRIGRCRKAARAVTAKKGGRQMRSIYGNRVVLILFVGFLLAVGIGWLDKREEIKTKVARGEPGRGVQEKEFFVDIKGEMENYPLKLEIGEQKLTREQREEYLDRAKRELDLLILGENSSKDEITQALYLPEYLQNGVVEASYRFSDYDIFHLDGTLRQEPKEAVVVEVTAELICQEEVCLYQFSVQAVPPEKSSQQQIAEKLKALISTQNQEEGKDYVNLPEEVDGQTVVWRQKMGNRGLIVAFMSVAVAAGLIFHEKEVSKRKKRERDSQMMLDYAGIVGKFSLLIGAGMNIPLAWEKIALAYQEKREGKEVEKRYAYEEMLYTLHEIRDGMGELKAYENFGNRCGLGAYRRLSAMIVQNVRKGTQGMQRLLEQEEWEAYEQRKAHARQAGEEAGTKLLLPMGIMLVIVLAILVIPAGMTLNL